MFQAYAASDNMHVLEMLSFKETQAGGFSRGPCLRVFRKPEWMIRKEAEERGGKFRENENKLRAK